MANGGQDSVRRQWPSPRVQERQTTDASSRNPNVSPTPTGASGFHSDQMNNPPSSSLSSLPQPSQEPPQSSGSRRIVKNGVVIVRSSDTEEDSDSSLEDVSVILNRPKIPSSASSTPPIRTTMEDESGRATNMFARRPIHSRTRAPPRPKPSYQFSLAALVDFTREDVNSAVRIADAKAELEMKKEGLSASKKDAIDQALLASVIEDGEDDHKAQRLLQAIERTDALHKDTVWHFFEDQASATLPRSSPFPKDALPSQGWARILKSK